MSTQITEAFVEAFSSNFIHLAQQTSSRFESRVMIESGIVGVSKTINRLGTRTAQRRLTRHGDTPINDQPHSTRFIDLFDWEDGDMIDDQDKIRMLAEPGNDYIKAMVQGLNRAKDDVIIAAAVGAARHTTGTTAVANTIVHGSAGMNRAKLAAARKTFRLNEADEVEGGTLYLAMGAEQLEDLLNDTGLTTAEYNTALSLRDGKVNDAMLFGFNIVPCERLPKSGSTRTCIAWEKSGLALGIGADVVTKVGERADKGFNVQYYAKMSLGAVRVEEARVVPIECNE